MKVTVYFDGAAEPNPGVASWGAVLSGEPFPATVELMGALDGRRTNNEAEYRALEAALEHLRDNPPAGMTVVEVFGDSQLVVKQITGEWQAKSPHLAEARDRCRALLAGLGVPWSVSWVPREQNADADRLSEAAWTAATGKAFPEKPAWKKK